MVKFFLNDKEVIADENETIWQVAKKNGLVLLTFVIPINPVTELTEIAEPAWFPLKVREY